MADKDETIPVSSDQNTKPKMSLATNHTERRSIYEDQAVERSYECFITAKHIPKTKPKPKPNENKETE